MKTLTNDTEIELAGETHFLRPSLKAASAISRQFGGFLGAMQAIAQSNLEAAQFIVRQGIASKNISTEDLNDAVWRAGSKSWTNPVMKYVSVLQNGGRDPDGVEDDDSSEPAGNGEI